MEIDEEEEVVLLSKIPPWIKDDYRVRSRRLEKEYVSNHAPLNGVVTLSTVGFVFLFNYCVENADSDLRARLLKVLAASEPSQDPSRSMLYVDHKLQHLCKFGTLEQLEDYCWNVWVLIKPHLSRGWRNLAHWTATVGFLNDEDSRGKAIDRLKRLAEREYGTTRSGIVYKPVKRKKKKQGGTPKEQRRE
jgi:hypothetical protein